MPAIHHFRIAPFLLFAALPLRADVTPGVLFQSNAVLQQGRVLPVWGAADAGEKVTVTYSAGPTIRTASTTTGPDGRWSLEFPALAASATPATLTFAGKNTVTCENVLVGEVWLASGQSNMEWALSWKNHVTNAQAEIAAADFPQIREIKIRPASAETPQASASANWRICNPSNAGNFSAVSHFFARDLHRTLNVPVGIISAAWSGAPIEPFMTSASLAADPNGPALLNTWKTKMTDYPANKARFDSDLSAWNVAKAEATKSGTPFTQKAPPAPAGPTHQSAPSGAYHAMIHPLVPYALRGVIWYQGESNVGRHAQYLTLFPSLIAGWREVFKQTDMPFYWVQLANYASNGSAQGTAFALLREAQDRTLAVPHTGQALAIDIGDSTDIHPANKQDVGHRLARLALRRTYGKTEVVDSGPRFTRVELNAGAPNRLRVHFDHVAAGLRNTRAADPSVVLGFEVSGEDKIFHSCEARIEDPVTGVVSVFAPPEVPSPVFVRYAFRDDPKNTLANSAGLPTAPFRTDP